MHARLTGWQSAVLAAALLSSLVAGVVVAHADAESSPAPGADIQDVPQVPATPEAASGRAVGDSDLTSDDLDDAASESEDQSVTVVYTVESGDGAEIRETEVDHRDDAADLVTELSMQPRVAAAEIDTVYAALGEAGSGNSGRSAPRDGAERERQWGLDALQADHLWKHAHACGATIAIVDSGINLQHPDLAGTVRSGKNIVGDGKGLTDASGHGTEVAGVAAAAHDNGQGISGMAPGVRVLPIAIEDSAGQMRASDLARGVQFAIKREVDVINLSLGGPVQSPNVEYWLEQATEAGIPVVAAAGNAYRKDNPTIWPAASAHTIAVGALAPTGIWAPFSSTGQYIDVVAPGVAVLTTAGDGRYVAGNGTSLSAPFVSATVAMMRVRAPDASPDELRQVLVSSAKDVGPKGWDPKFGHGIVDPLAALSAVGGTPHKCFSDIGALTLADQIERLAFAGVTDGCEPRKILGRGSAEAPARVSRDAKFCPAQPVTRGQMATFLSRAASQPPTDADFFDDDEASIHEQGINRLAQANIARGCTTESFCPNDPVTRGQMAAFLSRALDLPSGAIDAFTDDSGDVHEAAINALAARGITGGCDAGQPERFCPDDTVTRAQMAAFLTRMIDARTQ
jgi:subtilisin family serine protease